VQGTSPATGGHGQCTRIAVIPPGAIPGGPLEIVAKSLHLTQLMDRLDELFAGSASRR
jgi:hypothetical protein